jgi:hypothetical protein
MKALMQLLLVLLGMAGVYKLAKAADAASGKPVVRCHVGYSGRGLLEGKGKRKRRSRGKSATFRHCRLSIERLTAHPFWPLSSTQTSQNPREFKENPAE